MDTAKLKRFAAEARVNLMEGVRRKLRSLGFDENGESNAEPELIQGGTLWKGEEYPEAFYHQWTALKERIKTHSVREVVEEAAYTWFNRMMAIRILSKNELCEPILATEGNVSGYPLLLESARMGQIPEMSAQERHRFDKLMEDDTMTSEQFSLLLTIWCHNNPIIDSCFGSINGYVELLLPDNIIRPDGFIALLNNTGFINKEDFRSAELIGWLYQFYISERKDEVMKKQKYAADEIPAATQIFTPNWIVKYMVENTILPQVNASDEILDKAKYLVKNPDAKPSVKIELEDLKVADFACGSGHILNECFDLLFALYRDEAYSRKETIECIFTKNLIGIDIDLRAKQLAMFALLLKACQRDASFADAHCMPRILTVPEMSDIVQEARGYLPHFFLESLSADATKELVDVWEDLKHADVLGSIIKFNISPSTRRQILEAVQHWRNEDFISDGIKAGLPIMDFILALTDSYNAIVMNPPYMGAGKMSSLLSAYVKENYPNSKTDLATIFIEMTPNHLKYDGKYGFIIPPSWMFLGSFERLRKHLLSIISIDSFLHLSRGVFGADFGSSCAVFTNHPPTASTNGMYFRLIDRTFQEFDQKHLKELFESTLINNNFKFKFKDYTKQVIKIEHSDDGVKTYYPHVYQNEILGIPYSPITSYFACPSLKELLFNGSTVGDSFSVKSGLSTGDNDLFLRFWFEPNFRRTNLSIDCNQDKWRPYTKGLGVQKWYGNNILVVDWENDASNMRTCGKAVFRNESYYFKRGITWSGMSSSSSTFRYLPDGYVFDSNKGPMVFPKEGNSIFYVLGLLNSSVGNLLINQIFNPSVSTQISDVERVPYIFSQDKLGNLESLSEICVKISKEAWDAYETSWDFKTNPLVFSIYDNGWGKLENSMGDFELTWEHRFNKLHENEEELNRQFIEIYNLQDELTPDVPLDEVTILQQGEKSIDNGKIKWNREVIIQQLISYIVGCYMGRYRLDRIYDNGIHIAHPNPSEEELAEYKIDFTHNATFKIDSDAIIPVLPQGAPFYDNLYNYVEQFVKMVWEEEDLQENMNFIQSCLGKPLNEYLMKDFWKYHKKMYQNRPIYWEFASKKGAFRALVYAHRMDKFTVEVLRSKYLLPYINFIEQKIANLDARQSDLSTAERRELDNLRKKILPELREYHDRVEQVAAETAARTTVFDLDDGIIKNHALFGDIVTKLK